MAASMDEHNAAGERKNDKITLTSSTEYKDYLFNAKHDIWALVTLKAPCYEDDENKRAPIDVVAVIDKSGSMAGEKISLVRKTLEFILTQLNEKDRLCIVTYDTNVYVQYQLSKMDGDNKNAALEKIRNIQSGTSTNLCGGLMKGLCQIIDRSPGNRNEVASVLLFTDGLANVGIRSSQGIVQAMKNPKQFDGPSCNDYAAAPHHSWLKKLGITKKEMTQVVDKPAGDGKPADATVYTFGFGDDHDEQMLKDISDAGNGMYYYIENEDKIAESFGHCLGGLLSTVAQGIQLEVVMEHGVVIKEVHTGRPFEIRGDRKSVKVNVGDLQSEESRDVVFELAIDAVPMPYQTTPQTLCNTSVNYFSVITNLLENITGRLSVFRSAEQTVHDPTTSNVQVKKQRARVRVANALKSANSKADSGDLTGARSVLLTEIDDLNAEKSSYQREGIENEEIYEDVQSNYRGMLDDLQMCTSNFENARAWERRGKKLQLNMIQQHDYQRSSNVSSTSYVTRRKAQSKEAAQEFVKK